MGCGRERRLTAAAWLRGRSKVESENMGKLYSLLADSRER